MMENNFKLMSLRLHRYHWQMEIPRRVSRPVPLDASLNFILVVAYSLSLRAWAAHFFNFSSPTDIRESMG